MVVQSSSGKGLGRAALFAIGLATLALSGPIGTAQAQSVSPVASQPSPLVITQFLRSPLPTFDERGRSLGTLRAGALPAAPVPVVAVAADGGLVGFGHQGGVRFARSADIDLNETPLVASDIGALDPAAARLGRDIPVCPGDPRCSSLDRAD